MVALRTIDELDWAGIGLSVFYYDHDIKNIRTITVAGAV